MDNLITIFMNYKVNRLVEYGVFLTHKDTDFSRYVFREYFRVYVDNFYYGIFHTLDEEKFSRENLVLEFKGIMEEMLDEYRAYELRVSNEEYNDNRKLIQDLNPICYEITRFNELEITDKDVIPEILSKFLQGNEVLRNLCGDRIPHMARLLRETYLNSEKLLHFENMYYELKEVKFFQTDTEVMMEVTPIIKALSVYRKSMVKKIYQDERLEQAKLEVLIQKLSLQILRKSLMNEEMPLYFIEIPDAMITRGRIENNIASLIDNPLFQKYVVLAVSYNTYLAQKQAFSEDYQFACLQDFRYVNDIYQKTEAIYNEGIFNYLIVRDCREIDHDYFVDYHNESMKVLLFEEE